MDVQGRYKRVTHGITHIQVQQGDIQDQPLPVAVRVLLVRRGRGLAGALYQPPLGRLRRVWVPTSCTHVMCPRHIPTSCTHGMYPRHVSTPRALTFSDRKPFFRSRIYFSDHPETARKHFRFTFGPISTPSEKITEAQCRMVAIVRPNRRGFA